MKNLRSTLLFGGGFLSAVILFVILSNQNPSHDNIQSPVKANS